MKKLDLSVCIIYNHNCKRLEFYECHDMIVKLLLYDIIFPYVFENHVKHIYT